MHRQNQRPRGEARNSNKLLVQARRWIGIEQVAQHVVDVATEQRIAVRRRLRRQLRRDRTIRPRTIVHDHWLTQCFVEFLCDLPDAHVSRRPCNPWLQDSDRLDGIVLRPCRCRQGACCERLCCGDSAEVVHRTSLHGRRTANAGMPNLLQAAPDKLDQLWQNSLHP